MVPQTLTDVGSATSRPACRHQTPADAPPRSARLDGLVQRKAGRTAAAHRDMRRRRRSAAGQLQHIGDLRLQRDRGVGEIVAACGEIGGEVRQIRASRRRAARPPRSRPAARAKTSGVGSATPGLTSRMAQGGNGGAGADARRCPRPAPAGRRGTSARRRRASRRGRTAPPRASPRATDRPARAAPRRHRPIRRRGRPPRECAW